MFACGADGNAVPRDRVCNKSVPVS
jgi:hypothetical protein